jgi:acetolactate synthase I/II/III large subunit
VAWSSPQFDHHAAFQEKIKYGRTSGVQLGDYDIVQYAGAFGATGIRVQTMEERETALRRSLARESLAEPGVTIIDVRVDYTHNTDLYAQLHEGVLD